VIDLHTHILAGVDDGARTIEESIDLLKAEIKSGVRTVALTPHFKYTAAEQADFLLRRDKAYKALQKAVIKHKLPVELILGAEIAYSTDLLELDLDPLCYEGTKTLLIELPMEHYPAYAREVFYRLMQDGYTPIVAHVERYPYFSGKPDLLEELADSGALIQVNSNSIIKRGKTRKRVMKMISSGLVDALATDTHRVDMRPPKLDKAVKVIEKKLGTEAAKRLVSLEP